jgi:hypothetical protein
MTAKEAKMETKATKTPEGWDPVSKKNAEAESL